MSVILFNSSDPNLKKDGQFISSTLLGSMQGMFGASVSELYLLNKLLINIEDSRSMCDHKKKYTCVHRNCESGLAIIYKHAAHRLVQHTLH